MALRTNYKDDIFSGNRKYSQILNGDGTISFTDETQYSQVGDSFGATQINEIDGKINTHDSNISTINSNIGTINSNINTINSNINSLNSELTASGTKFYFDYKDGKWGWNSSSARGAGTFHPFKTAVVLDAIAFGTAPSGSETSGTLGQTGKYYDYVCCFGIGTGDGVNRYGGWNFVCSSGNTIYSDGGYYSGGSAAIFQSVSAGSSIGYNCTRVGPRPPQRNFRIYGFTN